MLVKISTNKTLSEVAAALHAAVQANHFGVMQVHNLKETMAKKGVEFKKECLIFEVCQPQQAKKVLEQNMSVSTALPCRISVYGPRFWRCLTRRNLGAWPRKWRTRL
jgi:uncharacterized protein (DUF302 family)